MRRVAGLILVVLFALAPGVAWGQPPEEITHEEIAEWFEGVQAVFGPDPYSAISTVVTVDGELLFSDARGVANKEGDVPADAEEHVFRVGSVTKLVNALAVVQLAERGMIDLDADVRTYLEHDLDLPLGEVTMRHLLSHTAGFADSLEDLFTGDPGDLVDLPTSIERQPRQIYAPGTVTAYSNYSAMVAGYIVERVSGQPWADYVEENILEPLGMDSTSVRQPLPEELQARLARAYPDGGEIPQDFEYMSDAPAGVMTSTAIDMARFGNFLLDGDPAVLGERAHDEWLLGGPLPDMDALSGAGYMSMGIAHTDRAGTPSFGHSGDTLAYHSVLEVWPEERVVLFATATDSMATAFLPHIFAEDVLGIEVHETEVADEAAQQAEAVAATTVRNARTNHSFAGQFMAPTIRASATEDGGLSFLGSHFVWAGDWCWVEPETAFPLCARYVNGEVDALQTDPYSTWVPGGLPTLPVAAAATISLVVLLLASAVAGISSLVTRKRVTQDRPSGWWKAAGRLGAWTSVIFIAGLAVKLWSIAVYLQFFVPSPVVTHSTRNQPLEILGTLLLLGAVVGVGGALLTAIRHGRAGRRGSTLGWGVTALAGMVLTWALIYLGLFFSPMVA